MCLTSKYMDLIELRKCPEVCLEDMRKTTRNVNACIMDVGWLSSSVNSEYETLNTTIQEFTINKHHILSPPDI
jgi:hypothetical protein